MKKIKDKKCKECGAIYTPFNSIQQVCSPKCASILAEKKVWKKKKAELICKSRTRTEWLNMLQVIYNKWIRLRDEKLNCISCGKKVINGHASHLFSVGNYPNLRFNEDNTHLSCIECNLHLHGNIAEYTLRLPARIGQERFNKLIEEKDKPLKLSLDEIKELIKIYKSKIKEHDKRNV